MVTGIPWNYRNHSRVLVYDLRFGLISLVHFKYLQILKKSQFVQGGDGRWLTGYKTLFQRQRLQYR